MQPAAAWLRATASRGGGGGACCGGYHGACAAGALARSRCGGPPSREPSEGSSAQTASIREPSEGSSAQTASVREPSEGSSAQTASVREPSEGSSAQLASVREPSEGSSVQPTSALAVRAAQSFSDAIPTLPMPASWAAAITRMTQPYLALSSPLIAMRPSVCAFSLFLSCSTIWS